MEDAFAGMILSIALYGLGHLLKSLFKVLWRAKQRFTDGLECCFACGVVSMIQHKKQTHFPRVEIVKANFTYVNEPIKRVSCSKCGLNELQCSIKHNWSGEGPCCCEIFGQQIQASAEFERLTKYIKNGPVDRA